MNLDIRDRIVEFKRVKASELVPHPLNWRPHPQNQRDALIGILKEVGYVGALVVRKHGNGYQIIDGHLRAQTTPSMEVPVLVVDLDDDETALVLASYDPLSRMAGSDTLILAQLLDSISTSSEGLSQLLTSLTPVEEKTDKVEDGTTLKALTIPNTQESPRHLSQVELGQTWICGPHRVLIIDVCNDWSKAVKQLSTSDENALFVPYGGPLILLSMGAKMRQVVITQPVPFVAALILDWWDDAHQETLAVLA